MLSFGNILGQKGKSNRKVLRKIGQASPASPDYADAVAQASRKCTEKLDIHRLHPARMRSLNRISSPGNCGENTGIRHSPRFVAYRFRRLRAGSQPVNQSRLT
jgi:hypothetical protein